MRNALTFDVEDYVHVESAASIVRPSDWPAYAPRVDVNTRRILDLLERATVKATFFVLGWVADRHPSLVREIAERGHEVACHSYAHRLVYTMTLDEFRADVRRARAAIEDAAGVRVVGYRAPTFSIVDRSLWALDVLADEGFQYDSSIFPIHHDRYGMPRAPRFPHAMRLAGGRILAEFPMTTVNVAGTRLPFCGGGYFRLLPYPVIRRGLRRVNGRDGQPAIVYLHPWEFDPGQPRLAMRRLSRMRHYVNLRTTETKLERLLADFSFGPARDVLDERLALGVAS
jgi:polysaccharide deacetylase family protein (PEP-CTERM system associated)